MMEIMAMRCWKNSTGGLHGWGLTGKFLNSWNG